LAVAVNQNRTICPLQPGFHVDVASVYRIHLFIAAFPVQMNFISGVSSPVFLMVGSHIHIISAQDAFFTHIGRPVSRDLKFATRITSVHLVRAPLVRHKYPGGPIAIFPNNRIKLLIGHPFQSFYHQNSPTSVFIVLICRPLKSTHH
jgi:hypothetical protein